MTHIIQKQILELTLDEGPEKLARQEDLVRNFRENTLPAMSELFDRLAPDDTIWKINHLELDLGSVSPENLEKQVLEQLEKQLKEQFHPHSALPDKNTLEIISNQQGLFRQFLHFLQKGHFTWSANGITLSQMEKELPEVFRRLQTAEKNEFWKVLRFPKVQRRLELQFSGRLQKQIVKNLLPFGEMDLLTKLFENAFSDKEKLTFHMVALSAFAENPRCTQKEFLLALLQKFEHIHKLTEKVSFRKALLAEAKNTLWAKTLEKVLTPNTHISPEKPEETALPQIISEREAPDSIYINNAGMVILWPYLQRFFQNQKLVEGTDFIHREAREKAARILQYLVDPQKEITENLLPLNKILCGMAVEDLIPTTSEEGENHLPSKEEQKACEELLNAVIVNWKKIGNTTVPGFQTSFLQREGRLEKKEEGWSLKVEQRSFDMLLDSLPWSITLIKLPWMPRPLHVEW